MQCITLRIVQIQIIMVGLNTKLSIVTPMLVNAAEYAAIAGDADKKMKRVKK